ncbi:MAG: TlpA family protein disulfide reductase, partial [Muribaculaceae bacterium]|nr:TlpA family protein disulfide reductase [Muribaculaceae bacterium]
SRLTPEAQNSILMPLVERQKAGVEKKLAAEKRTLELQSGTVEAPAFTLLDLNDKPVSLKDFRGKWVVLDFWGAWCRWCIKGFPELKEAYKDAAGKFEVIGIDNRDTPERWKEAVAKYELPWVNVYNPDSPEGLALLENYAVQGFPTKVFIDPQGIIRHVTVGEDPSFFTVLRELIK